MGRTAAIGLCGILALLLTALTASAGTATAVVPRPFASPAGALLVTFDIQVDAGAAAVAIPAETANAVSKAARIPQTPIAAIRPTYPLGPDA